MTDLSSLVAKLEAATVPTRELFDEIGRAIESADSKFSLFRFHQLLGADAFLEAALMLVPERWNVFSSTFADKRGAAHLSKADIIDSSIIIPKQVNAAFALYIAALKARKLA